MAKKKAPADAFEFLRGEIASRHTDELLQQGLGLQLLVRRDYEPHPSTGTCTAKQICTASILCLITEGPGRTGCEPTGIFRTDCPITLL
ncbi:MAG TPA: hypothetical protein VNU44_08500 [Bryobacteraceae bacterium]|jgi:hypothetical protein|nr:hypothetical protein [Bryobacteraceae bacterium]